MKALVDHVFELVQNSVKAHSSRVNVRILEDPARNLMRLIVEDDGDGIRQERISRITVDPFWTREHSPRSRVSLGLPLLHQHCMDTEGSLKGSSRVDVGTRVEASMRYDHVDRAPLGDVASLFYTCLCMGPHPIEWTLEHKRGLKGYRKTSGAIRRELGVERLDTGDALRRLRPYLLELEGLL